jgi:hypothetical protein
MSAGSVKATGWGDSQQAAILKKQGTDLDTPSQYPLGGTDIQIMSMIRAASQMNPAKLADFFS